MTAKMNGGTFLVLQRILKTRANVATYSRLKRYWANTMFVPWLVM